MDYNIHITTSDRFGLLKIPAGQANNYMQTMELQHVPIYLSSATRMLFSQTSFFAFVTFYPLPFLHTAPNPSGLFGSSLRHQPRLNP